MILTMFLNETAMMRMVMEMGVILMVMLLLFS